MVTFVIPGGDISNFDDRGNSIIDGIYIKSVLNECLRPKRSVYYKFKVYQSILDLAFFSTKC